MTTSIWQELFKKDFALWQVQTKSMHAKERTSHDDKNNGACLFVLLGTKQLKNSPKQTDLHLKWLLWITISFGSAIKLGMRS